MDQVDATQPLETPTSVEKQSQAITNDIPSTIDAAHKRPEAHQDHPLPSEKIESRSVRVDDVDDVQIIFSVPRRRKRKRKRLEYPHSSAESPRLSQRPESEPPASRIPTSEGLLGASRTLGDSHSREESAVSTSIFTPSSSALHLSPNMPHLGFGPTYGYAQIPHSAALASSSMPWWDSTRSQSNPILDRDWRDWPFEEVMGKKRRHDYEWEMPAQQRTEFRQSSQISPRTIPMTTRAPLEYNSMGTGFDSVDLLGRPNHSLLATNLWPSFDWDSFNDSNTNQFISQSLEQAKIPMESSKVSKVCNGSSSQQQSRTDLRQKQMSPLRAWRSGQQAEIPTTEKSLPTVGNALPVGRLSGRERENDAIANKSLPRIGDQITLQGSCQPDLVPPAPCKGLDITNFQPESDGIAVTRTSPPRASPRTMRTPDILRKPSLYKIPPWPSSSAALSDQSSSICNEATTNRVPSSNNLPRDTRTEAARKHDALSNSSPVETHRPNSRIPVTSIDSLASTQQNPPSKSKGHASEGAFQIPKARLSRKHSPNLIIDIAETCQELFPFATVAERHKVPIKKVFDTFSAIIQLPLLRNADDRRRHGSLGKLRVKEYRDAKKAMERAQEAERKAQMKAMRARVEEAARKGKAQAQTRPLLKTAILNNAKETQNGAGGS